MKKYRLSFSTISAFYISKKESSRYASSPTLAKQTFKEALGDGIWVKLIESEPQSNSIGASDDPIQKGLNQPMDASVAAQMYAVVPRY
ncbi:hypothetical protein Tco_1002482 [Tanacetum coccineum]|uniref:Uncharacterized protein n=1 Tax=Tanacetum coccineum TaxID=301880 RepID=A0ABQ5F6Z9_9ASTR